MLSLIDLDDLRTPFVDDPKPRKYVLSATTRRLVERAAAFTGQDMSTIVDLVLRENLPEVSDEDLASRQRTS